MVSAASNYGENFIFGFHGPSVPQWLADFAENYGLGGVILFDFYVQTKKYENNIYDAPQLTNLCREIHALPSRPMIFIDQEGGKVRRLKESRGFQPFPSQEKFNLLSRDEKIGCARIAFRELNRIGIDCNLAPVIDLNLNPENSDIGKVERSYSVKIDEIRENVRIVAAVAREEKIQLCLKHFPGLGGAKTNSHEELTDLTDSYLESQEQLFYELVLTIPGEAILLSHGILQNWDPEVPTSVSEFALARIRSQTPQALCITDDLQMQGLQLRLGTKEAVLGALAAGNDLALIGNTMKNEEDQSESFIEAVITRAETDKNFQQKLKMSHERIAQRKVLARQNQF